MASYSGRYYEATAEREWSWQAKASESQEYGPRELMVLASMYLYSALTVLTVATSGPGVGTIRDHRSPHNKM
ncbi:hypothetical protein GGR53DRAFT_465028 [Hypoxylon sp. FL1150]|nr:hypothetical protein GGR53DRAFT_465028 [Hypoxylon sp. FL1150]